MINLYRGGGGGSGAIVLHTVRNIASETFPHFVFPILIIQTVFSFEMNQTFIVY